LSATVKRLEGRLRVARSGPAEDESRTDVRALAKQVERQAMILERDNAVARKLQDSLRPLWLADLEGIDIAVRSRSGARVGGDFFDVIRISDTCLALLIADVSGYGLPAAVIMATARMAFRTFATQESGPKAILAKANKSRLESSRAGHHLTAFLGVLDTEILTFQYVNASHPTPYLLRDGEVTPLDTDGLFVGMFDDPQYEQKYLQLRKKDKLFMLTNGLILEFSGGHTDSAVTSLQHFLRKESAAPIGDLVHTVAGRVSRQPEDDVAILGVELLRPQARHKTIEISSIPSEMRRVEDVILPALSARGYGERSLFAVKLALEEAVINAIKHGNELDPTKKVTIDFELHEGKAVFAVTDEGDGFDPDAIPDPTTVEQIESSYGRGLVLMRAYMDSVAYNETGNKVTMMKNAPWHPTTGTR